jgi:putative SOS response-associated peptidase YedK
MCGRFTRTNDFFSEHVAAHKLAEQLSLFEPLPPLPPSYNIAPTQQIAAVRADDHDRHELVWLRWGLVPGWADDLSIGNRMINARSESVATKPAFRHAFKRRRCLILADGFYEWQKTGKAKQPYFIQMKGSGPFCFAGLWERWSKGDKPVESCTILTTDANELMAPLHDRMPVIIPPESYNLWLDVAVQEPERLLPLLHPFPDKDMVAYPVSTLVNSPRNNAPECIEPEH